jgi:hypothetical protein
LTPRSIDQLLSSLEEVRDAQRHALGLEPEAESEPASRRPGALHQMAHAARVATGSAPVARLWQTSLRGRMVIIGGAVLFVALGILASVVTR